MAMMYTIPISNGEEVRAEENFTVSEAGSLDNSYTGMNDPTINPRILIQHYLYYPYQELGYIPKLFAKGGEFEGETITPSINACENIADTPENRTRLNKCIDDEYKKDDNSGKLKDFLTNKQVVWNTNNHEDAENDVDPLQLRPHNFPTTGFTYGEARQGDPKFLLMLKDENPNSSSSDNKPNVGEVLTTPILYRLFKDDPVRYFEKPQMRYMNKLFNSLDANQDGQLEFNENYTLKEIWLAIEDSNQIKEKPLEGENATEEEALFDEGDSIAFLGSLKNQIEDSGFTVIPVPEAEGYENHHDPSKIYFTNDKQNAKFNNPAWTSQPTSNENLKWAKKTSSGGAEEDVIYPIGSIMIYVPDGLIIRFVFDPTTGNDYINEDVDFFDYDISDGFIYPTKNAAQNAFNKKDLTLLVVDGNDIYEATKSGSSYLQNPDGSYVPNKEKNLTSLLQNGSNKLKDSSELDDYYFPTDTQGKALLKNQTWFALTYEQGINEVRPKTSNEDTIPSHYTYAFGNVNTLTGLGSLEWNFFGAQQGDSSKDQNISEEQKKTYIAYLNKYNHYNSFSKTNPNRPNLLGATYNLPAESNTTTATIIASGPNEDNTGVTKDNIILNWENNIDAPFLFDIYNTTNQKGMTVYSKKLRNTDYFPLYFERTGGTYVLDKVLHKNQSGQDLDDAETNLKELLEIKRKPSNKVHSNIRTNQFWPMDSAPSYGTNGHDLKFGESNAKNEGIDTRQAVGKKDQPDISSGTANFDDKSFPPSDDGEDHNSYFGMKFQIPFTLEDGYAAHLNYFFFGDDDMFVFLSKCTRADDEEGTIIDIDYESTVQIADLGGVHSSIGTYVNLWNFIPNANKVKINTRQGNGIREDIYYYKTDSTASHTSEMSEEDEDETPKAPPHQDYVLTFFYTERGASGSSCYMRFTVPFKGLSTVSRAQDGEIKISKEVKTAELVQSTPSVEIEKEKYIFELNLKNADDSRFTNVYPIVIHNEAHEPDLANAIVNTNANSLIPTIEGELGNQYQTITDTGRFTLSSGQHAYIYGLPRKGPYGTNYTFTITEVGIYKGDPSSSTGRDLYSKDNYSELDEKTTTTFRSGEFSNNPNSDLFEKENWITDFKEDVSFSDQIGSQNAVEFVNSRAPASLSLTKQLDGEIPKDFAGLFNFQIELKDKDGYRFIKVPYFSSDSAHIGNDSNGENEPGTLNSVNHDGLFTLSLKPEETVTLYGLPLETEFKIQEIGISNGGSYTYSFENLITSGPDASKATINEEIVTGKLETVSKSLNQETDINTSISAVYTNLLEKLNQLRIRKLLRPASGTMLDSTDEHYDFSFKITLTNNDQPLEQEEVPFKYLTPRNATESTIALENGVGYFTLKHSEEIEIYDLPPNTQWLIEELDNKGQPVELNGKIDNTYFLSWEEQNSGTLNSENGVPEALFVNIKPDPNNTGGLKILAGNRPTDLKEGEFNLILKGVSASYQEEENEETGEENNSEEENSQTTESDMNSSVEMSSESMSNSNENSSSSSDSPDVSESSEESSSTISNTENSSESINDFESLETDSDSPKTEEENSSIENNLESTFESSESPSLEESMSSQEPVQLTKRMNKYIQPMSINIVPQLAQMLSHPNLFLEKIYSSFNLNPSLKEGGVGVVGGAVELPPLPAGSKNNEYIIPINDVMDNTGLFSFPEISFKKAGVYIYELSEEIPTLKDSTIAYSSEKYWVKVTVVSKNSDEKAKAFEVKSVEYFLDEKLEKPAPDNIARFINMYIPPTTPPGGGGEEIPNPSISLVKEQRKISNGIASSWNKQDRDDPMYVISEDQIEYRITVSNTSDTIAQNVVIKDTLPIPEGTEAQLVLDPISLQGQDVTLQGRELTWNIGNLTGKGTSGASQSVTFKVNVPEVSSHTLWPNTATATFGPNPSSPLESITSNTVVSETNPGEIVQGESNITLFKEQRKISGTTASEWNTQDRDNPMIIAGGDIVEYRLTATVSGQETLSNVIIQDKIPDFEGAAGNLTLIPSSLSGEVNVNNGGITWNLGNMQPGESKSVTFQVVVPLTEGQTIWANIATVSHGEDPHNPEETISSNTVVIEENPESARIKLFKEQRKIVNGVASEWNTQDRTNPMMVNGGDVVEYRVTASAQGQAPLYNVVIRDQIPNYEGSPGLLTLDETSLSGNATFDNGLIIWNIGTMQPGESQSITFQVSVPKTEGITLWSNVATVSHGEDPNNPEETISSNIVTIAEGPNTGEPDISLVKEQRLIRNGVTSDWNTQSRDNPMTVQANDIVEYRLVVTNKTAHSVPNVVVKDTIPSPSGSNAQLTLIDQKTTKGTARADGHILIWEIGNMAPQEVVSVFFQVRIPAVSASTLWPNIGSAIYGEDPNHPDKEVPSNEVDIREDPGTSGNTPPNTSNTTPNSPNTPTTPNTNNTNNTPNPETSSSSKNPATKPGTYATTGTNTNTTTWIIVALISLVVLCLGGYWWKTNKKGK